MKKTSEQWQDLCNVIIMDPDGWDRQNFDFSWKEELITREEFEKRLIHSSCSHSNPVYNEDTSLKVWKDL